MKIGPKIVVITNILIATYFTIVIVTRILPRISRDDIGSLLGGMFTVFVILWGWEKTLETNRRYLRLQAFKKR